VGNGEADKYFKCTETKNVMCCSECNNAYCYPYCSNDDGCETRQVSVEIECQTTLKAGSAGLDRYADIHNATYTLKDADNFWKDLNDEFGVEKSWVKFGRRHVRTNNGCQYAPDVNECQDRQDNWFYNYNYPLKDVVKVYNPKSLVGDSYEKTKDLLRRIKIVRDNTQYDELMRMSDVVDASSLPALTAQTAVASMDQIVKTVDEIKKREREELIVGFITGLLFFIPLSGEAAGAAGLTAARSLLRLASVAGESGMLFTTSLKTRKMPL
jgi:hypothetical protein